MDKEFFLTHINSYWNTTLAALNNETTYIQAGVIVAIYLVAYWLSAKAVKAGSGKSDNPPIHNHPMWKLWIRISQILYPIFAIIMLRMAMEFGENAAYPVWLVKIAVTLAVLLFFYSIIREFVSSPAMSLIFRWIGLPMLLLHLLDMLPAIISTLTEISLSIGNIEITLYGLLRVLFFGVLLFWLGRASNNVGKDIIRNQASLDISTREVFTKLFEVGLFCIVVLLLLNVMGINLTTLAVFGGAVGVGLGLGLQSIASNFISGIIILLDKSLTVGDFVELEDGRMGFVRQFNMRHAVLETYDGKDILVPNETFISSLLINWTHKDPKQRYRVDFSVAYATDVRAMVEIIKTVVAEHPQVISGEAVPFEERPDCEIDSFGDNGINMFVEFWMDGVDDGKNRVGGDLLLTILETLKAHDISIPFPQREVTVLNKGFGDS